MVCEDTQLDRRKVLQYGGTGMVVAIAGCSGLGGRGQSNMQVAAGSNWDPIRLEVTPQTEVTWQNEGSFPHSVTSAKFHDKATEWDFDDELSSGEKTTHTFEKEGIYEHYSKSRGDGKNSMCGVVLVGDVSLDAKLPCESKE